MRHARLALAIVIGLIFLAGCGGAQSIDQDQKQSQALRSDKANADLRLSLELPQQEYAANEEYPVKLSLTNIGKKDLKFDMARLFGITVLDEDGDMVWPDGTIPRLDDFHPSTLAEGKTHTQELFFKVEKPGTYKIISRLASGPLKQAASGRLIKNNTPLDLKTDPVIIKVK